MMLGRRRLLQAGWGAAIMKAGAGVGRAATTVPPPAKSSAGASRPPLAQHFPFGPVLPTRPARPWLVVTHEAERTDLMSVLKGRVTALQLMFTGCSATCPIQGALFAQAQRDLQWPPAAAGAAQFISFSIDPLSDTPAALAAWLRKFSARPGWTALAPRPADLAAVTALLGDGGEPLPSTPQDPHTGQVYLFDMAGRLVYRLPSLPSPKAIDEALVRVANRR